MGEAIGVDFPDLENLADIAARLPQFEFLELVGRGGMGVVYKARQPQLDRLVAIKILPPGDAGSPMFVERFRREARTLARLSHPNIVAVYDFGEAGPLFYFVMEYVDGVNLRQLEQGRQLSPQQALSIVPRICAALQAAHDLGIVHRDIKPENILIDRAGQVKIADFGIARIVQGEAPAATLTATSQVVGTPRYMAPEQATGSQEVDHRADIFSLGVVFYEMLTGTPPAGHFAPPSQKVEVDVRLDQVVLKALEQEPARRYQRAREMQTDVEAIKDASTPAAAAVPPPTSSTVNASVARRSPLKWAIAAAVLLAALAIYFFAGDQIQAAWHQARVEKNQTALFEAASQGRVATIATCVGAGADLNARDPAGLSPLHRAAAAGRVTAVQWLVLHGADMNSRDLQQQTPLMAAAANNQAEVIEALYTLHQAIRNARSAVRESRSPLQIPRPPEAGPEPRRPSTIKEALAIYGQGLPREFLDDVDEGALSELAMRTAQDVQGETALMKAVKAGHIHAALAIRASDEEGCQDHAGRTAAMHAALHGQTAVVQELLRKADIGYGTAIGNFQYHSALSPESLARTDKAGKTAIQLAEEKGHTEVAALLRGEMQRAIAHFARALEAGDRHGAAYLRRRSFAPLPTRRRAAPVSPPIVRPHSP